MEKLVVRMVSIDDAVAKKMIKGSPNVLKIDVEGGEVEVLKGAMKTIAEHKPNMILAVHSDELESACRSLLEPLGYVFEDICQDKGDKELIARVPQMA